MTKFRVGDTVEFYGRDGVVKEVHKSHLYVKRFDGIGGPAWEGTPHEGLWLVEVSSVNLIKSAVTILENK